MSIKKYKEAFSGIEPSRELHDSLVEAALKEEKSMRGRHVRPKMLAACAAVLVLCISMTAAAAFNLNEVFHNFFQEETVQEDGQTTAVPLEAGNDFLVSAGNVIDEQTAGNGLKLTLRGTVGDGNVLYAAIDVETEDGSPFTQEQERDIRSYRFEDVKLEGEGIAMRYCWLDRIDDGSVPGKATFLLSETFDEELKGRTLRLSLSNLMMESNNILDLEMDKTIWELMQEFEPLTADQVYKDSTGESRDAEGNVTYYESFMSAKTDKRLAFSAKYPEAAISNLGIWQGDLGSYLLMNLEFGGEWDEDLADQKNLLILDQRNGQQLSTSMGGGSIGNGAEEDYFPGFPNQSDIEGKNTIIACRYCFDNISENQLKNAVFALGGDGSYEELFAGDWELDFTVNYEETMKTWEFPENVQAGNIVLEKIQISPVSAVVKFDTLSDEKVDFKDVSLKMKDGTLVEQAAMSWDEDPAKADNCRILWKSVVNPEEIESISINGREIPL